MKAIASAINAGNALTNFTPETLYIDRTYQGLFRMFQVLGAELRFNNPNLQTEASA